MAGGEPIAPLFMGAFRDKPLQHEEQYAAVNDQKLRMTISAMSDRYSEDIRDLIYRTYQDDRLAMIYRGIRASGIYQHGGKSRVRRKIIEFPNRFVYDFVDTALRALYGADWLSNPKALRHPLVKPWLVVQRL